jgi:hypothetical protein
LKLRSGTAARISSLGVGHDAGPAGGRRLLDVAERVGREDALLVGPVEGPLERDDGVPLTALPRARVEPASDVDRLQFVGLSSAVERAKTLKEVLVPDVGGLLVVNLGVREEQVAHLRDEDLTGLWQVRRVGGHELVEGVEDDGRRVPRTLRLLRRRGTFGVLAEADLFGVVFDVPGAECGAVPRLWLTHE